MEPSAGGGTPAEPPTVRRRWTKRGRIYLSLLDRVVRFEPDGQTNWSWQAEIVSPALVAGQVYVPHTWTSIDAVSQTVDQQRLWSFEMPDIIATAPVVANDGTLYMSSQLHLFALRPPHPLPSAQSAWPMFRANARHTGRVGDP